MKIKSIKLRNFRQFMNIDIDFSTEKKKNVSVIIAENSTGKTTLMQSIKWCLYGDEETDLDNKNQLLNQYVQQTSNQEKEPLSVEVTIEEEKVDYTIKRVREVIRKNNRTSEEILSLEYKDSSGETKIIKSHVNGTSNELNKINRMINQILTREMSRYFLFDGERINNLGTNNAKSRKDIREAIGAINGFNILDNSLNYSYS
ncbi:AAA family ATPase [Jeotgalibaca caeni]|uniref:AAA family ATPase n=1 Tax=Jeotgalibaca caeni TaxID=3028623 RepID=UPI00237D6547|nr:AAA family ATPase [Jeotgalibaca caeni]MDE1549617.1 AAA family ATPase [Jeotgalibaca caeni]